MRLTRYDQADAGGPGSSRPVLVTGLPRSGTSWVGKMLQASRQLVYVNEPLNPRHPPGRCPGVLDVEVTHQFQYICADNDRPWSAAFGDTTGLRYRLLRELRRNHGAYDLARTLKYLSAFTAGRLRGRRALLDDPYAVLSSAWFARHLNCQVVVLVRHPVTFVGSWQRLDWTVDLRQLLDQPLLVRDLPDNFVAELDRLAGTEDRIAKAALLWRLTYTLVHQHLAEAGDDIRLRRYEDLAADPTCEFRRLFHELGLTWNPRAERRIRAATFGTNDAQHRGATEQAHPWSLRGGVSRTAYRPMRSTEALTSYRDRLTPAEIDRVRALTVDVAPSFYPNSQTAQADAGEMGAP